MTAFFCASAEECELDGLRDEGESEGEVEDVGPREQARERAPLGDLAAGEAAVRAGRALVGLGVEAVALEDEEPRVDAAPAGPGRSSTGSRPC